MNDQELGSPVPEGMGHEADGQLSRRRLLWMLGGTAGAAAMATRLWPGIASAGQADVSPTLPVPSIPPPAVTPPAGVPSVAELAASLDWDVEKIFRHVADEIHYDAYVGALRGSTGALWGRAGNATDQTLLLASLLNEAVVTYRFVVGELDQEQAAVLAASTAAADDESWRRSARVLLPPDVADAWTGVGPWRRAPEVEQLLTEARERVAATVTAIQTALDAAGVTLPETETLPVPDGERVRHVWLQYADGPDWIDLDPSMPDAESGKVYATPTETLDVLPDDMFHTVTFRIVAEVVTGGVPTRTELLSHTVRSADMTGLAINLMHGPAEWLGVAGAITGSRQYVPALVVGDEVVEGAILAVSEGGGVLGALGDEGTAEGQTLAEWVEVDVTVPGQPVRQSVRSIFDRLSAEQRASDQLDLEGLPPITMVHVGDDVGDVFTPLASVHMFTVAAQPVPWSYFADDPEAINELELAAGIAHSYPYLRDLTRLDQHADIDGRFYADEPSVVALSISPGEASDDDRKNLSLNVDIFHAHHAANGADGAGVLGSRGLVAGALDHAAERMVFEGALSVIPEPPEGRYVSVGRIFEVAAEEGIAIVALRSATQGDMPGIERAAAARISEALAAGKVVVVPETSVMLEGLPRSGWWEIDPLSGATLDRLDDGRGDALGEFMLLIYEMSHWALCIISIGGVIYGIAQGATGTAMAWGAVGVGACIAAGASGIPGAGVH